MISDTYGLPDQMRPCAWTSYPDLHDYARNGSHDPYDCRHCLRCELAKLGGFEDDSAQREEWRRAYEARKARMA